MSPPGKNSGCTTNESVVKAMRGGVRRRGRLIVQLAEDGVVEGGQKQSRISCAVSGRRCRGPSRWSCAATRQNGKRARQSANAYQPCLTIALVMPRFNRTPDAARRCSRRRKRPSAETMVAPSGVCGVHALPKAGQWCGFFNPCRIWPLMQIVRFLGVGCRSTSKIRSAS